MIGERLFKKEETACGVWLLEEGKYIVAVETNKDMVYRIALHDCRNRHDAEDIMQIVFLKLYRSAVAFESPEHLKNWLIRVTVNECRRMFVSPWKKHEECREYLPEEGAAWGFDSEEARRDQEILQAVMALPRKFRVPVYLYYYEGYQAAEIAILLKKNPSTIQTRLMRARKHLKISLEEAGIYGR